mmetsp:Transcript_23238/g.80961  ORF Transcript_23238/g.80961 Transcript_23238/m.80961 type:complete len:252 (+) Transcript_23238:4296-5051(+)
MCSTWSGMVDTADARTVNAVLFTTCRRRGGPGSTYTFSRAVAGFTHPGSPGACPLMHAVAVTKYGPTAGVSSTASAMDSSPVRMRSGESRFVTHDATSEPTRPMSSRISRVGSSSPRLLPLISSACSVSRPDSPSGWMCTTLRAMRMRYFASSRPGRSSRSDGSVDIVGCVNTSARGSPTSTSTVTVGLVSASTVTWRTYVPLGSCTNSSISGLTMPNWYVMESSGWSRCTLSKVIWPSTTSSTTTESSVR